MNLTADGPDMFRENAAGNGMDLAYPFMMFSDYTVHNNTGNTTENTIYSKVIRGGLVGANGGLDFIMRVNASAQGAGSTTVRFKFAGVTAQQVLIAAAHQGFYRWRVRCKNAVNANDANLTFETMSGTFPAAAAISGINVDFSVDETFSVTVQNANNTDVQAFDMADLLLRNSFGPV